MPRGWWVSAPCLFFALCRKGHPKAGHPPQEVAPVGAALGGWGARAFSSTRGRGCTSQGLCRLMELEHPSWGKGLHLTFSKPQLGPWSRAYFLVQSLALCGPGQVTSWPSLSFLPYGTGAQGLAHREGSVEGGCYCPIFQVEKPRLRAFPGCLKVVPPRTAGSGVWSPGSWAPRGTRGTGRYREVLRAGGRAGRRQICTVPDMRPTHKISIHV